MHGSFALFVLLVVAIVSVSGHNWVTSPVTRDNNVAQQNKPCDTGTETLVNQFRGQNLNVAWTNQHTGNHDFYLVPAADESTLETLTTPWKTYPVTQASDSMNIPGDLVPGHYVLQYRWSDYRNCIDLQILAQPPANAVARTDNPLVYTIPEGSFDSSTGITTCNDGYVPDAAGNCAVSFGRYVGVVFLIAIIFALVLVVVYFVYLKMKNPELYQQRVNMIRCRGSADAPAPASDLP